MDGSTMRTSTSYFVRLGKEHPGWEQALLPKDASPSEIEAAQWGDGARYYERQQRMRSIT